MIRQLLPLRLDAAVVFFTLLLHASGAAAVNMSESPAASPNSEEIRKIIQDSLLAREAAFAKWAANGRTPSNSSANLLQFYKNLSAIRGIEQASVPSVLPKHKLDKAYLSSINDALQTRPYIWLPDRSATKNDYPEAIALVGYLTSPSGQASIIGVCTGTVIAPTTILSAAHCVCELGNNVWAVLGTSDFRSSAGIILNIVEKKTRIRDCAAYEQGDPQIKRDTLRDSGDVGLFFVAEDMTRYQIVPAIINGSFHSKASYYIVGYGVSDTDPRPGAKRLATIQGIECAARSAADYGCNPGFEFWGDGRQITGRTDHPDSCAGDSGGPVFTADESKPSKVVGVVSRPINGTTCGQGGIYVGLNGFIFQWIDEQVKDRFANLSPK